MKNIRIVHSNDVHSCFDKFIKMAYYIEQLKNDNTLLLDGGDYNDFSSPYTFGSNGYLGLKLLNDLGYNALTIGNNEGFNDVTLLEKMASYNFVNILSCNLKQTNGENIKNIKSSIIKEINGIKFLIIGASPYGESYNMYYNLHGLTSYNPTQFIRNEISTNKGKYDFIILLSHLGLKSDILMSQSIKEIDIIIGGHSHHAMDVKKVNNTIIHQSGVRGSHIGYLDLKIENGKIIDFSGKNIEITDSNKDNLQLKEEYEKLKQKSIEKLKEPLFKVPCDLMSTISTESNLTNVVADYMYDNYSSDMALINSGLTERNLEKGYVSDYDLLEVCNSPLQVETISIKAKFVLESLKESCSVEKCNDTHRRPGYRGKYLGKLQVSYNCQIIVENNIINLFINGKQVAENDTLIIVTTDYFQRGMGYSLLGNNKLIKMYKESTFNVIKLALQSKEAYNHLEKERWCFK